MGLCLGGGWHACTMRIIIKTQLLTEQHYVNIYNCFLYTYTLFLFRSAINRPYVVPKSTLKTCNFTFHSEFIRLIFKPSDLVRKIIAFIQRSHLYQTF